MGLIIGVSCFLGGALVGAVLMAIMVNGRNDDNYGDTDHLKYV